MKIVLRKMGNSQGVIIPKTVIAELELEYEVNMTVKDKQIILSKPRDAVRVGWELAAQELTATDNDSLVWPELANQEDEDLQW